MKRRPYSCYSIAIRIKTDPFAHDYSEDVARESYKRLSAKYHTGKPVEHDFDTALRVGQIIKEEGRKYAGWEKTGAVDA